MDILGNNLKYIRLSKCIGVNELGRKSGVNSSYISAIERGAKTNPSTETLKRMAKALDVPLSSILHVQSPKGINISIDCVMEKNAEYSRPVKTVTLFPIPVLKTVRATELFKAEQNIIRYEYLPEDIAKGRSFFGLKAVGDSMNASSIYDGDIVIAQEQYVVENGDTIVVLVGGENAVIRKFFKIGTNVTLIPNSTNPTHQPVIVNTSKTRVEILGKVVRVITDYK